MDNAMTTLIADASEESEDEFVERGSEVSKYDVMIMLKEQMFTITAMKEFQKEQSAEIKIAFNRFSVQIEEYSERLSRLERRFDNEMQEIVVIKDEMAKLKKSSRRPDAVPLAYEIRLAEIEGKVQQAGEALEEMSWTEEKMASVHATLLTTLHQDLKAELLEELSNQPCVLTKKDMPQPKQRRLETTDVVESGLLISSTSYGRLATNDFSTPTMNSHSQLKPKPRPRSTASSIDRTVSFESQRSISKRLLQKPMSYDGSTTWEAYFAQFEIIVKVNE